MIRYLKRAGAALAAFFVVLGSVGFITSPAGADSNNELNQRVHPQVKSSESHSVTITDKVIPSITYPVDTACSNSIGQYVQRGDNQTVPKLKVSGEFTVVAPVVPTSTVPYQFGSRAVTQATLYITNIDIFRPEEREISVSYWCTTDINQAWLVFG